MKEAVNELMAKVKYRILHLKFFNACNNLPSICPWHTAGPCPLLVLHIIRTLHNVTWHNKRVVLVPSAPAVTRLRVTTSRKQHSCIRARVTNTLHKLHTSSNQVSAYKKVHQQEPYRTRHTVCVSVWGCECLYKNRTVLYIARYLSQWDTVQPSSRTVLHLSKLKAILYMWAAACRPCWLKKLKWPSHFATCFGLLAAETHKDRMPSDAIPT